MLTTTLPLIATSSPEAVIARRGSERINARQFLQQAIQVATQLPAGAQLLNLCEDRYHFAVGLVAGLIAGRSTLLPPTQAPEVLRQVHALGAPLMGLGDRPEAPAALAQLGSPWLNLGTLRPITTSASASWSIPQIDAATPAVVIYTSGSTGAPVPHVKSFGQLVAAARVQMTRLPPHDATAGYALLGTVPAQHMFGLESTVMLPLQSGGVLCAERPFFPADIAAALGALPRPRALVSTPVHLRALLDGGVTLPPLDLVLCATAALSESLAREVEARCDTQLLEIFGSTETGQIASRRTARERAWHLWPEVRLRCAEDRCWAHGGHVPTPTLLADVLEPLDEAHFVLHGRTADLVNVAGKRSSLAHLSQQLLSVPGVLDGAFFVYEPARGSITGVARLAAVVVAPSLTPAKILEALRERIDAVFLPRPLWLVQQLPRNATGKLPHEALQALAAQLAAAVAGVDA
ncbi:MAG TPA: AMP-binding protein [Steroidobacteraceae bacterium]|jgi:acyl-coenzyme A synthetase/AMP-(fatty) acid ligase|nr:AMP-binding protein [Steroidobacteraceae bacterium]